MGKFFIIQSWMALAICTLIAWRIAPAIGSCSILAGAVLSGVVWCGLPSFNYNQAVKDGVAEKWAQSYMAMISYKTEIFTQLVLTAIFFAVAYFFDWRVFWFLTGGGIISSFNVLVRGVWAKLGGYV